MIVLERGRVAEAGSVDILRRGQGWFARFAQSASGIEPVVSEDHLRSPHES